DWRAGGASPGTPAARRRRSRPARLALQRQRCHDLLAVGVALAESEAMATGVMQGQTPAHIVEPEAGTPPSGPAALPAAAGVLDLDVQRIAFGADADGDLQPAVTLAVLDGVLDQRLQQEARDPSRCRAGIDRDRGLETLAEARLLHPQIGRQPADLG